MSRAIGINPVFAVWLAGRSMLRRRLTGRLATVGLWLGLAGLSALLAGNVLEFGWRAAVALEDE